MWLSRRLRSVTAAAAIAIAVVAAAPAGKGGEEMHAGVQLSGTTFKSTTSDGIWLVEHYSPWCHHCKAFAPTWRELVDLRTPQGETINFHFGQVDCSVNGDLCDENNVKGYPSIFLYENGEYIEQFKKERTLDRLNKWLDDRLPDDPAFVRATAAPAGPAPAVEEKKAPAPIAAVEAPVPKKEGKKPMGLVRIKEVKHAAEEAEATAASTAAAVVESQTVEAEATSSSTRTAEAAAVATATALEAEAPGPIFQVQQPKAQAQTHHKRFTPNAEGKLLSVDPATLDRYLSRSGEMGPVFVKYFAPWCGHCKTLAPIWAQLAGALKGKVNVLELDCDESRNKAKCRAEKVTGYPTLVFYNAGERAVYNGARNLKAMEAYASKAALSSGLQPLEGATELESIAQEEEVFFLYLHPSNTPEGEVSLVRTATRSLVGSAPVYESESPELFTRFSYPAGHAYLLVFKSHEWEHPSLSYNFSTPRSTSTNPDLARGQRQEGLELQTEVTRWLHAHSLPVLAELTSANYASYIEAQAEGRSKAPAFVVLAAISKQRLGIEGAERAVYSLEKIAKTWLAGLRTHPRSRSGSEKATHFVWVDSDKWSRFLSSSYGLKPFDKEPTVLLLDPSEDRFFPKDGKGNTIRIEGNQIFESLESLYGKTTLPKLRAVTTVGWGDRTGKWLAGHLGWIVLFAGSHPFVAAVLAMLAFVLLFCTLVYYMDGAGATEEGSRTSHHNGASPPVHQPKYVESKHSLYGERGHHSHGGRGAAVKKD